MQQHEAVRPQTIAADRLFLAGAVALVALATLFPYRFSWAIADEHLRTSALGLEFGPVYLRDIVQNVALFVPLGFALAWFRRAKLRRLLSIVLLGAAISLAIEVVQLGLPRDPSWLDLMSNSAGTLAGSLLYMRGMRRAVAPGPRPVHERSGGAVRRWAGVMLVLWCALVMTFSIWAQRQLYPTNWSPTYPLMFGNERTGDRAWSGEVRRFRFYDEALPGGTALWVSRGMGLEAVEPVVSFEFPELHDRVDRVPQLEAREGAVANADRSVRFTERAWLETQGAASAIAYRVNPRREFSIHLIARTANNWQEGPARIVSHADGLYRGNFMVAQEDGSSLMVRVRTPVTGPNGEYPVLYVPGVFAKTEWRNVVITFSQAVLRLWVDGKESEHVLMLSPGAVIWRKAGGVPFAEDLPGAMALYLWASALPMVVLPLLAFRSLAMKLTIAVLLPLVLLNVAPLAVGHHLLPRFGQLCLGGLVAAVLAAGWWMAAAQHGNRTETRVLDSARELSGR